MRGRITPPFSPRLVNIRDSLVQEVEQQAAAVLSDTESHSLDVHDLLGRVTAGQLVHSAYYEDAEVIEEIADFIAGHGPAGDMPDDEVEMAYVLAEIGRDQRLMHALASGDTTANNGLIRRRFRFQG